jgi:hypothetical protein
MTEGRFWAKLAGNQKIQKLGNGNARHRWTRVDGHSTSNGTLSAITSVSPTRQGDCMAPSEKMQELVPEHVYGMWFSVCEFTENSVICPNDFTANRLNKYHLAELTEAFGGQAPRIEVQAPKNTDERAKEAAEEIKKQIAPKNDQPVLQQMWLPCAPMPTDLCRASPFFPIARQNLGQRDFIEDMVIATSSWGEILYTGPRLSTYEEDVLSAVLAILDQIEHRKNTDEDGRYTYTYQGPLRPILKLVLPGTKKFGKTNYKKVLRALKLMAATAIELRIKKGSKISTIEIVNILSRAKWDEDKKELTVTVNPFFYECYARGSVTLLDVLQRSKLRSPVAKSLYRFAMSHRNDVWKGHFLTLAAALNLDLEQPQKEIKRRIKRAIKTLAGHKLLTVDSGIPRNSDTVKTHRTLFAKQRQQLE